MLELGRIRDIFWFVGWWGWGPRPILCHFLTPPPHLRSVHVIESVITSMIKGVAVLIYIMTFHIEEEMIINLILIFWGLLSHTVFQNRSRIYRIKNFASVIIKFSNGKIFKSDLYMILYFLSTFFFHLGKYDTINMIQLLCCLFQDTSPAGHFQVGCEHRFVWQTAAACPIQTSQGDGANCTVTNPSTGQWIKPTPHPPSKKKKKRVFVFVINLLTVADPRLLVHDNCVN